MDRISSLDYEEGDMLYKQILKLPFRPMMEGLSAGPTEASVGRG